MSKIDLYPLKFDPIFKDKIWGGQKLNKVLNKDIDPAINCGESWELSAVKGDPSIVAEGELKGRSLPDLIEEYQEQIVGNKTLKEYGNEFPLLIKFIDANQDLSIQVHPNDELAAKRHDSLGKTEMWYVMHAEKEASLITGFSQSTNKEEYLKYFEEGKLTDLLNEEKVETGDVYFIPAGRVHTIGAGLLIAEIQQTSDVTYRIYDFDRKDDQGNLRELHVEEALDAIDYNHYPDYKTAYSNKINEVNELVKSEYFSTQKINLNKESSFDYTDKDSFVIYTCVKGKAIIKTNTTTTTIESGEVVLIPASLNNVLISPSEEGVEILETYV